MLHQIGRTRTPDISVCGCEGGERLVEFDRRFFVFGDEDALVEGLVGEPLAQVVGALVHLRAVGQKS